MYLSACTIQLICVIKKYKEKSLQITQSRQFLGYFGFFLSG